MRFTIGDIIAVTWAAGCGLAGWKLQDREQFVPAICGLVFITTLYLGFVIWSGKSVLSNPQRPGHSWFHDFIVFSSPVIFEAAAMLSGKWFTQLDPISDFIDRYLH